MMSAMTCSLSVSAASVTFVLVFLLLPSAPAASHSLPEFVHRWFNTDSHEPPNQTQVHVSVPSPRSPFHVTSRSTVSALPAYVVGAGSSNRTQLFPIQYSKSMMHRPEIDLIGSYLRRTDVYLEYGIGGSTINFSPLVARAYSIEHNCEWANYIADDLRLSTRSFAYANLDIKCVSIEPGFRSWGTLSKYEHANYYQFREYVDAVDMLPEVTFDKVFIDGRARVACALKVLPYLTNSSVVFMHDFFSRTMLYSSVLRYYKEVARIRAYRNNDPTLGPVDEPQGLIVLRRRPDAPHALTPDQIHAVYEEIDWRFPFDPPLDNIHGILCYIRTYADISRWKRARSPTSLVSLVLSDVAFVLVFYGLVILCSTLHYLRKAQHFPQKAAPKMHRPPRPVSTQTSLKFMETESMKAAKGRRNKSFQQSNVPG